MESVSFMLSCEVAVPSLSGLHCSCFFGLCFCVCLGFPIYLFFVCLYFLWKYFHNLFKYIPLLKKKKSFISTDINALTFSLSPMNLLKICKQEEDQISRELRS